MCYHTQFIFAFLVQTGFHHVGQAGIKLLTSGDLPTSASQSAGITGISRHSRPLSFFLEIASYYITKAKFKFLSSNYPLASAS